MSVPDGERSRGLCRREAVHSVGLDLHCVLVRLDNVRGNAHLANAPFIDPDGVAAEADNLSRGVTHKQQSTVGAEAINPSQALPLEGLVAHGQRFVHNQDLGLNMNADGKCQPRAHADGVALDRLVHEIANAGEIGYRVEFLENFGPLQSQDAAGSRFVRTLGIGVPISSVFGQQPIPLNERSSRPT